MRKTLWLAAVLALLLSLTACSGGGEAPSPAVPEDQRQVTDASELEGKWSSPSGSILYFVADEGCYYYQTFSGRTGQGRYDTSGDVPMIDFDGFLYDFILRDDGVLLPNQNGSGDAESFDHFTFTRSDARVDIWDIAQLDGVWQNALGETLVIDSQRMEYLSYTRLSAGSGTIGDAGDGKGPYLAMDGFMRTSPPAWRRTASPCCRMGKRTATSPACSTPMARWRPIPACRGPALSWTRTTCAAGTATDTTPSTSPEATPSTMTAWPIGRTGRCTPPVLTRWITTPPRTGAKTG